VRGEIRTGSERTGGLARKPDGRIGRLPGTKLHPALVNGAAGVVITVRGLPCAVMGFTVAHGKIVEIDAIVDPERVGRIAAAVLREE
jgi:hypothetical protein